MTLTPAQREAEPKFIVRKFYFADAFEKAINDFFEKGYVLHLFSGDIEGGELGVIAVFARKAVLR